MLQVLDARDPLPYLSKGIDDFLVERKKERSFLVLNKIGTFRLVFFFPSRLK